MQARQAAQAATVKMSHRGELAQPPTTSQQVAVVVRQAQAARPEQVVWPARQAAQATRLPPLDQAAAALTAQARLRVARVRQAKYGSGSRRERTNYFCKD